MTQTDSLSRKIALIALAVIGYGCSLDEIDAEHLFLKDRRQLQQLEPLIASELAEREKQVEELIAAFQEVMESERLKTGLTPAQFKQVWARQLAALSRLGVTK